MQIKEQLLNKLSISESILDGILEDLKNNNLEQVQENRYILKYKYILEYASNLIKINDQAIFILKRRLNGETLLSISNELNITRERVRQIQSKCFRNIKNNLKLKETSIKEERFRPIFEKYNLDKNLFIVLTEDTLQSYNYLNSVTKKGATPIQEILNDKTIPNWIIKNYKQYLKNSINSQFLCVTEDNNRLINKTRTDIVEYVLSKYCCDECTFDEFVNIYQQFLSKYNLENDEKLRITDAEQRSQENQLSRSNIVLWKYGKKLRYYNIAERDYTELLQTLNLDQYENIEISTLKFIREYPKIMKKYDIRDEYELHNLLRKIGFGENNSNISFNMPYICFGEFNRNEMVKNFLFELAPISAENLAEAISKEYGFQTLTIMSSWFKCIQEYYKDGMYSVDYKPLPENHMQLLQENLTEDFYYISEIKEIYKSLVPNADLTLISSFNLKRMGFIVNSKYVIQHHSSANNYFKYILTNQDIVDTSKFNSKYNCLQMYYQTIEDLRNDYEIIEFEPYQYINIHKLNSMGIDKSNFISYCDEVCNYIEDNSYFTIKSLIDNGFSSNIDFLGFDNCFYGSILKQDQRFSYIKLGGTVLFYKGNTTINQTTFLIYLLDSFEKIDFNELLDHVLQKYGIHLDKFKIKSCIKNSNLYYDDIMEKVYNNYKIYLEELNSIDDNT